MSVGSIADSVVGVFAGSTDLLANRGWERALVIPVFLGACALAMLGIHRIEAAAQQRTPTFTSRAMAVGGKTVLAIVIFVTAYAMSIAASGPRLPMVMMFGLLAAT